MRLRAMEEVFGSDEKGLKGDGEALKDARKELKFDKKAFKRRQSWT